MNKKNIGFILTEKVMTEIGEEMLGTIGKNLGGIASQVGGYFKNNSIGDIAGQAWNGLKGMWDGKTMSGIKGAVSSGLSSLGGGINTAIDKGQQFGKNLATPGAFPKVPDAMPPAAAAMPGGASPMASAIAPPLPATPMQQAVPQTPKPLPAPQTPRPETGTPSYRPPAPATPPPAAPSIPSVTARPTPPPATQPTIQPRDVFEQNKMDADKLLHPDTAALKYKDRPGWSRAADGSWKEANKPSIGPAADKMLNPNKGGVQALTPRKF